MSASSPTNSISDTLPQSSSISNHIHDTQSTPPSVDSFSNNSALNNNLELLSQTPDSLNTLSISFKWPELVYKDPSIDLWSLEYIETPLLDQLTCSICQCAFVEPYSTKCGHTFCKRCLYQALEIESSDSLDAETPKTSRCPIDRNSLTSKSTDISPAPVVINNLANDLVVYCPNKARGCMHQCARWLAESHVKHDCEYSHFECEGILADGRKCLSPLEKRYITAAREEAIQSLEKHFNTAGIPDESLDGSTNNSLEISQENTESQLRFENSPKRSPELSVACYHEITECPNQCGVKVPKYMLAKHTKTCRNISRQCELCGTHITGVDLTQHPNICPAVVTPCTAAEFGCQWVGKRSQFCMEHQQECQFVAFSPALSRQKAQIYQVEQENRALKSTVERMLVVLQSMPVQGTEPRRFGNSPELSNLRNPGSLSTESTNSTQLTEPDFNYLFMESERLRSDVHRLNTQIAEIEMRHNMAMMQESFRTNEELTSLRGLVSNLRHQIHFLLADRRSWAASMQQLQFQQQKQNKQHLFPFLSQSNQPSIVSNPQAQDGITGLSSGFGFLNSSSLNESTAFGFPGTDNLAGDSPRRSSESRSRLDIKL